MIKPRDLVLMLTSGAFALMVLLVLLVLEYGFPAYIPLWVYALIFAFTYAMLLGLTQEYRAIVRYPIPLLFTLAAGVLLLGSDDSSQSFMRTLYRVQPGMNITQVEAIMGRYNRYNKLFGFQNTKRLPSGQTVLIDPTIAAYKHSTPDDGAYNAASGIVHFKKGKVTSVEYVGD